MPRRSRDAGREVAPIKELDRREVAGAVADLGVLVPIVVALILVNGLSASAVLLPAGLLYVAAGWFYRLPIPVQPLKAFGAIAIAQGLGADVIAAGSLLMALVFIPLGLSGLLDRAAAIFPKPLVRGVQLSVGILLIRLAWGLVVEPPRQFADAGAPTALLVAGALVAGAAAYVWRARGITVVLVGIALVWVVARAHLPMTLGPSELRLHTPSASDFATAAVVLVVPQLPLTFANSCIATADAARGYFGAAASRVTAGRLAVSLGLGNVLAGLLGGMPVCHGAGASPLTGPSALGPAGHRSSSAPSSSCWPWWPVKSPGVRSRVSPCGSSPRCSESPGCCTSNFCAICGVAPSGASPSRPACWERW